MLTVRRKFSYYTHFFLFRKNTKKSFEDLSVERLHLRQRWRYHDICPVPRLASLALWLRLTAGPARSVRGIACCGYQCRTGDAKRLATIRPSDNQQHRKSCQSQLNFTSPTTLLLLAWLDDFWWRAGQLYATELEMMDVERCGIFVGFTKRDDVPDLRASVIQ